MERWEAWPLSWSAVWVGALTAVAVALLFGLIGLALGAYQIGAGFTDWQTVGFAALALSVFGAFLAFVAGGWVAGRIAGFRRAEPAMLHGGIVWLVALPLLLALAAVGAGGFFGTWFSGLGGTPAWASAAAPAGGDAAEAARNSALGALTALLLGLMGSVLGGWMASGEPMSLTYYRTREAPSERRAA
jgi:hypothetical protein